MATSESDYTVTSSRFPALTKTLTAHIKDIQTTATRIFFADKILITITQNGRLAHWVHVPLDISATDNPLSSPPSLDQDGDLPPSNHLPMHHLTAITVLGGTIPERDIYGQTLATQIASEILKKSSREGRMVVVGMGLKKRVSEGGEHNDIIDLVCKVL